MTRGPALPAGANAGDPPGQSYADLTEAALLASLGDVRLTAPPGTRWAYSNFGFMVLWSVLPRAAGQDFETLLARRLFGPLGMKQAYLTRRPAGVIAAQGHLPSRQPTSAWDGEVNLGGAGDVRASLEDMIQVGRYRLADYDNLGVKLSSRAGKLFIHPDGQPELELGHDSRGDFYPLAFDALLSPRRTRSGLTFDWTQGGGTVAAVRVSPGKAATTAAGKPALIRGCSPRGARSSLE